MEKPLVLSNSPRIHWFSQKLKKKGLQEIYQTLTEIENFKTAISKENGEIIISPVGLALFKVFDSESFIPSFLLKKTNVFPSLSPNEDRLIQAGLLSVLAICSLEYGISNIRLQELRHLLSAVFAKYPDHQHIAEYISKENVRNLLEDMHSYLGRRVDYEAPFSIDDEFIHLEKCLFFNPNVEEKPEKAMCQLYELIKEEVENRLAKPHFLFEKVSILESTLKEIERELRRPKVTFLVTSKLIEANTIFQKMRELLEKSQSSIRFMISYYDPRLSIFPQVVKDQIEANPDLEVKLLLRNEVENKRLVLDIKKRMYEEIRPRFSYALFDIKKEHGRMHAKTLIIDNKELLVGSANLTIPSLQQNVETAIYTTDTNAVLEASGFFDKLWSKVEINPNI